jgi:hypothetical protein
VETITARTAAADERDLAEQVLRAVEARFGLSGPLPYARVDLIHDADGAPRLLELELTEPSLFLGHGAGAADRLAGGGGGGPRRGGGGAAAGGGAAGGAAG